VATISALASVTAALPTPGKYPQYVVDFDEDASTRYNHIFEDLKEPLLDMENYWYSTMDEDARNIIIDNLDEYARAQPEIFAAMDSLARIIGVETHQTVLVNMITEFSTYCTSLVTRTSTNEVVHVRNLDFQYTDVMKNLVIDMIFVKNGQRVA
jgi:hypothetical protein